MAPQSPDDGECLQDDDKQYLFLVRHGDRWDYANPEWKKLPKSRTGDSPLSRLGHQQAREAGVFLDGFFAERNITANDITWMSSPFVRCLQTSNEALNAFQQVDVDNLKILPEYAVFEWDGHNGEWHKDLPPLEERVHYFPRVDLEYETIFVPEIPEDRSNFMNRCQKAIDGIHKRHPYSKKSAIVIVSHAAGCVMLSKLLSQSNLTDITPAAPCSIYGFTRSSNTNVWTLDAHDKKGGLNGHTDHISDLGTSTVPWNNFGDGKTKFYTGPKTSRFAPKEES